MDAGTDTGASITDTCWTCDTLQSYTDLTNSFAGNLGNALHDPILTLFTSLTALWIVIFGYKLFFKIADIGEFVKGLLFISITGLLLSSQADDLVSYIYTSAISIMGSSSKVAFDVAGGNADAVSNTGLVGLAESGEKALSKVLQIAGAVASAGSTFSPLCWLYAAIIVIPYFLLIAAYVSQVVVAIFRVMMVAVFAPFLFMSFAFNWGRTMSMAGIKTILASIMVLFASTAALALTIYGVSSIPIEAKDLTGEALKKFASITNADFDLILILGIVGTALMAEGVSVANSICGTALTNTAAGIMSAGAAVTGLALLRGSNPLGTGGFGRRYGDAAENAGRAVDGYKLAGGHAANVAGGTYRGAANLVDKFKNINKPGGTP